MLNRMSVAVALLLVLVTCAASSSPPTTRLDSGTIQGYHNDGVDIYRGVPYASPPVGTLRFKNAIPPLNWTGHRDTTTDGAACPQRCKLPAAACPPTQDESCLYLNVFVPALSSSSKDRTLLPILFWIHGGDYYQGYGGGLLYDGTSLASNENVIVVSINYRLGALGFLYSGPNPKTQFTGNYGISDQQEALRWVQRNAKAFGGNPDQVTIFGQSAGGESVGTLLNMASSKGLFSKAIAQSFPVGFPLREAAAAPVSKLCIPFVVAVVNHFLNICFLFLPHSSLPPPFFSPSFFHQSFTKVVAKDAGCDVSSPYETCMMNLTWEEVLAGAIKAETNVVAELSTFLDLFQPYGPTAGTPELPYQLMEGFLSGDALDLPLILGSVRQEGMIFIYEAFSKPVARAEEDALLVAIFGLKDIEKVLKQYPRNPAHYKDLRNHTVRRHCLLLLLDCVDW